MCTMKFKQSNTTLWVRGHSTHDVYFSAAYYQVESLDVATGQSLSCLHYTLWFILMHLKRIHFLGLEEYARLKPNFPKFNPRTTQISKLQLWAFRAEKYPKAKAKTYLFFSSGWHHSLNGKLVVFCFLLVVYYHVYLIMLLPSNSEGSSIYRFIVLGILCLSAFLDT